MVKQHTTKSIYDFIYLDTNKIHSYYAQLMNGLPNQKRTINKEGKIKGGRGVLGSTQVGLAELSKISSKEDNLEELMDMAHVLPRDMINLLDEHRLIARKLAANNLGKLILIEGLIQFIDIDTVNKTSGPVMEWTNSYTELTPEAISQNNNALKILDVLKAYPIRLQANIQVEGNQTLQYAWMSLQEDMLTNSHIDFSLKHALSPPENFYVLGVLDALPDRLIPSGVVDKQKKMHDKLFSSNAFNQVSLAMGDAFVTMVGRSKDFYGITPVCIFRKIDIPES